MNRIFLTVLSVSFAMTTAVGAATLDDVRQRGVLLCGVGEELPGFSMPTASDGWSGFHPDYCRAIAAAVLGDGEAVEFVELSDKERFSALAAGKVDLLARHTAWTLSRDASLGLVFAAASYYDGQAFMVGRDLGLVSVKELSGAPVCVLAGTVAELDMARFFDANNMVYEPVLLEKPEDVIAGYESGRCSTVTADASQLNAIRLTLSDPGAHVVLPEIISRKPVGPVVRGGDDRWFAVVKWVHFALVNAEELGVGSSNIDDLSDSADQDVRGLIGTDGAYGQALGLSEHWAADAVRAVGNYGEIYDRHLGQGSDRGMGRGLNALWRDGGIQYAPPIR